MAVRCSCSRSARDVACRHRPGRILELRQHPSRVQDADRLVLESLRVGRGQHHVAQPLGHPGRFFVGDRGHHQALDLVEPLEQPDGRRHVSHDVKQVRVDVLAALLVTLLGRAPRLVQVQVPLGGAFDDSRNAARAAQVVLEVEPPRRVEARGQQVVQRAPVESRRTHRLSVVARCQQPRRMPPPARDRQAQLDDHGGLQQRQVLDLVDDDAVEIAEWYGAPSRPLHGNERQLPGSARGPSASRSSGARAGSIS